MIFEIPFTDTTEARYAEIARKMVETNDWITPQHQYGVPFWGKPPLYSWVSALGMKIFGVNHFGARIFIFLIAIGVVAMLYRWVRLIRGRDDALAGAGVLVSCGLFYLAAATVMTDLVMVAGTSLSMMGFYVAIKKLKHEKLFGYLFFVGLAIGMLAKGPVAVVLTALPIGAWVLLTNSWRDCWLRLPWISGLLLTTALSVPWYLLAELKTPGFLEYFIVGEHLNRFLVSGWKGDLYGNGHAQIKGTIWWFWFLAMLPWSFFILAPLRRVKSVFKNVCQEDDRWTLYLICWALSPMIFFTMATNIIATYVFTGVPAMAFLAVDLWRKGGLSKGSWRFYSGSLVASLVIFGAAFLYFVLGGASGPKKSQMYVINQISGISDSSKGGIYYWKKRYYSAEFYTEGKSVILQGDEGFKPILENRQRDFLVIPRSNIDQLPTWAKDHFSTIGEFGKDTLLYENSNEQKGLAHE